MDKTYEHKLDKQIWLLREIYHNKVREHGVKQVAVGIGRHQKTLANEVNEYNRKQKHDWGDLIKVMAEIDDLTVLDGIERMFNRVAIPLDKYNKGVSEESLFVGLTDCLQRLGKFADKIKLARTDKSPGGKKITMKELDGIQTEGNQLISMVFAIVEQLKTGVDDE